MGTKVKKAPKDTSAPAKARAKPQYKETTKLARRQGALVGLLEDLDRRIKVNDATGQDLRLQREKAATELRSLLADFTARAASALGQESEPSVPESAE